MPDHSPIVPSCSVQYPINQSILTTIDHLLNPPSLVCLAPPSWFRLTAQMSMRGHLVVDSSTSSIGWFLNTSPLNKSPSTRPQLSRSRYAPSDVPSASKMKQRISEAFGSSKNIIYSDQNPDPGVPETPIPVQHNINIVPLQQSLVPHTSSLLTAPRSLLSSSPSNAAARRRLIPSPLPPSSPPSSSGVDETEEPAFHLHRHSTRNIETNDQYGLLRGHQKFSRLRRRHPPQKKVGGTPSALQRLDNLSPITPCAHTTSTNVSSGGGSSGFTSFAHSRRSEPTHQQGHRDGGGQQGRKRKFSDPDVSEGDSETLSGLLARLPRGRRQLQRQWQGSCATYMSESTTLEPPQTAVEKERGKRRRKTKAGDEASHLKGQDRVVRQYSDSIFSTDLNCPFVFLQAYEERRDARLAYYREVDEYRLYEEDVLWI